MKKWWNDKLTKWQIDKTASWQIGKLMEKEVSQMENRQNGNFYWKSGWINAISSFENH
jgi:hypothetical protein